MGRPQIAWLDDGAVAVSWVEFSEGRSQFRFRRVGGTGIRSPAATVADGMGAQHPRLARRQDELLLAWVENTRGTTRVRLATAPANVRTWKEELRRTMRITLLAMTIGLTAACSSGPQPPPFKPLLDTKALMETVDRPVRRRGLGIGRTDHHRGWH